MVQCITIVRAYSWSKKKTLGSDFLENCGLVVPNFLWVSSPGLHTLPREKFVSFSHKYQGTVEFWMRVNLLHMKQLNTAFETATFIMILSIFSSSSWWGMCSSGNWTKSVRPGGKYRSIRHKKISEIETGNFGRMERALSMWYGCKILPSFCPTHLWRFESFTTNWTLWLRLNCT